MYKGIANNAASPKGRRDHKNKVLTLGETSSSRIKTTWAKKEISKKKRENV